MDVYSPDALVYSVNQFRMPPEPDNASCRGGPLKARGVTSLLLLLANAVTLYIYIQHVVVVTSKTRYGFGETE